MSPFEIYVILKLDAIIISSVLLSIIFLIMCVVVVFYSYVQLDNNEARKRRGEKLFEFPHKLAIILLTCSIFFASIPVIVPSTKEALIIWGLPKIINNEKIDDITNNSLDLINQYIEDKLKDNAGVVERHTQ